MARTTFAIIGGAAQPVDPGGLSSQLLHAGNLYPRYDMVHEGRDHTQHHDGIGAGQARGGKRRDGDAGRLDLVRQQGLKDRGAGANDGGVVRMKCPDAPLEYCEAGLNTFSSGSTRHNELVIRFHSKAVKPYLPVAEGIRRGRDMST